MYAQLLSVTVADMTSRGVVMGFNLKQLVTILLVNMNMQCDTKYASEGKTDVSSECAGMKSEVD